VGSVHRVDHIVDQALHGSVDLLYRVRLPAQDGIAGEAQSQDGQRILLRRVAHSL
jgi:hypothetical protein